MVGPSRRSRHRVAAVAVLLIAIAAAVAACGYQGDTVAVVRLRNDLGERVAVDPCGDFHCRHVVGSVREHLQPGGTLSVNVSAEGPPTHYRVLGSGETPRCLSLDERDPGKRAVVQLSAAVGCAQPSRHALPSDAVVKEGVGKPLAQAAIGWAFYLLIVGVGVASIVLVIVRGYRHLRNRNVTGSSLALSTVAIGVGAFLGAWVVMDLYWLARGASRILHRPVPAT